MREVKIKEFDFSNHIDRSNFALDDVSFAHFNVGKGKATVMGGLKEGVLYYSVALCSPKDNFAKATGRRLADHHFLHSPNMRSAIRGRFETISPPIALFWALERFLRSKRRLPNWAKDVEISLRGNYKGDK